MKHRAVSKHDPRMTLSPSQATLDCLRTLIGFDTVSPNSNLECIDWARAHLEAHGAATRMDWNADRSKANMLATFGEGPGGTVFSGHVDVVSVEGQAWSSNPFEATIREGRVYGRGACDMKGFDAVILAHAPIYTATRHPIHVALTYDEELGCLGIPHLIEAMASWNVHPEFCIVGEPTSMCIVAEHKGGRVYRCHVTGHAAHSSLTPTAVNAIEYAGLLIARIHAIAARARETGLQVEGFDVPHTTISTNLIGGGNGPNIVPASCDFLFDYRYVPGDDPDAIITELESYAAELTTEMRRAHQSVGIAFEPVNAIPALRSAAHTPHFALARSLIADPTIGKVAYGTEAGFFETYGVPALVCGPGSIVQAHKADEYVSLDQLALCDRFIEGLVAKLSG